jgi:hypothetical protein
MAANTRPEDNKPTRPTVNERNAEISRDITNEKIICQITKLSCEGEQCPQRGCALARGVEYSTVGSTEAQADSLEAHSLKYHHCAQIFQLSSGRYALFGSYQVASGIDLLAIGTWAELEDHVKAYRLLADQQAADPRRISMRPKGAAAALDYSSLFED